MPSEPPYRVVLADDNALFRVLIKAILADLRDFDVAGEVADGVALLSLVASAKPEPQLAIVDIAMPDLGGIEATARIKSAHPGMKVLILTMHREKEYLRVAFSAGADGYLLKEDAGVELFPAIEMIRRGEVYISPVLREML
jgi:DNA-binding NarL/FixJ family response regulator